MARTPVDTSLILDAAYSAINRIGVRNLTMADIAEAGGVSRHTLYRRFQTKENLLRALGDRLVERSYEELLRSVQAAPDPAARVGVVVACSLRLARELPLGHLIELEPIWFRATVRRYFPDWVRVVTEMLTWPDPPPKGRRAQPLKQAAEAIV